MRPKCQNVIFTENKSMRWLGKPGRAHDMLDNPGSILFAGRKLPAAARTNLTKLMTGQQIPSMSFVPKRKPLRPHWRPHQAYMGRNPYFCKYIHMDSRDIHICISLSLHIYIYIYIYIYAYIYIYIYICVARKEIYHLYMEWSSNTWHEKHRFN